MTCFSVLLALCCIGFVASEFAAWPNPSSTKQVSSTIHVNKSETYDGGNVRYVADGLGDGGQSEDQDPVFFSVLLALCCIGFVASEFAAWPNPSSTKQVSSTIHVNKSETYDGGNVRYVADGLGDGGQSEDQDPVFELEDGATIKNVVLGAPAADGIHCLGSCTIQNCWWEDVGEDAATFKGDSSATYMVTGGGAKNASDKVFQHNGGGTLTIENFQVEDFGKLYRSCGNCKNNMIIDTIKATGPGKVIAGVNYNYGDSATLTNIQISGTVKEICVEYEGNNNGAEPPVEDQFNSTVDGDGKYCIYKKSDIESS